MTLPSIEMDLTSGNAWVNGSDPSDLQRLFTHLTEVARSTPGEGELVGEFHLEHLEHLELEAIAADPDFHPRVYLSPRSQIVVCARSEHEGAAVLSFCLDRARAGFLNKVDPERWVTNPIPAGTPHKVALRWDERQLLRVVLKIAYGVSSAWYAAHPQPCARCCPPVEELIRSDPGARSVTDYPVHEMAARSTSKYDRAMVVLLTPSRAVVGLFGDWYEISHEEWQPLPQTSEPVAAICTPGLDAPQRWLTPAETLELLQHLGDGSAR